MGVQQTLQQRAPLTTDNTYASGTQWIDQVGLAGYTRVDGNIGGVATWISSANSGDVIGPASSTDNAVVVFDGTTGKLIKNSVGILSVGGALSGLTQLDAGNVRVVGNTISSTNSNGSIVLSPNGTGLVNVTGDILVSTGVALKTGTSAGNSLLIQAYDTDTGPAYTTFITLTAGTSPSCAISGATIDNSVIGNSSAVAGTFSALTATGLSKMNAGQAFNRTATAVSYSVLVTDYLIGVTSNAAARTITLPVAPSNNQVFWVKDEAGTAQSANNITVTVDGVMLINGSTTYVITQNYQITGFYFTGTKYFTI